MLAHYSQLLLVDLYRDVNFISESCNVNIQQEVLN